MAIKHVLVAIDGTGSSEWIREDGANSHVFRFYKDFLGSGVSQPKEAKKSDKDHLKYYIAGPKISGLDVGDILDEATEKMHNAIGYALRSEAKSLDEVKVNIVGHSRGAFIALKLANRLGDPKEFERITQSGSGLRLALLKNTTKTAWPYIKVNFLGLYDAVKRSTAESPADLSLQNVNFKAHAIRNRAITRVSFGGVDVDINNKKIQMEFNTSHGGIGGDPGFFSPLQMLTKDPYCNALHLVGAADDVGFAGWAYGTYSAWKYGGSTQNTEKEILDYWDQSAKADVFIRGAALNAQVPLIKYSDLVPYHENEKVWGERLRKLIGK